MKKLVIIIISSIIFCLILGYILFFIENIEVLLKGNESINLLVNTSYKDEGIIVKNRNKIIPSNKYMVDKKSNLNIKVLGNYLIEYNITYKNKIYTLKRNINVYDNISPILEVNTEEIKKDYCTKKNITDFKFSASDNYDGDITDKIEQTIEDDKLILKVKDSSNNETTKEIKIIYSDKPKNKFILNGNNKVYVTLNGTYKESGAKYTDGCGNKLNKDIKISGDVDTSKLGEYKINYEVDGNKLTRTVIVYEPKKETSSGNKIIYLTFDDGPGYYTNKILKTLDKYNVKATFFVTHQFPSYASLIKTEYEKGHSIGVHTYTHNYKTIYDFYCKHKEDFIGDKYFNDFLNALYKHTLLVDSEIYDKMLDRFVFAIQKIKENNG